MWCSFTDLLTLLCTSLSKELSQWNEILIKAICMVYCWTFRILSAFPSDAGLNTILFENMMFRYKCNSPEQNNFSPGSIEHMDFIRLSFCRTFFVCFFRSFICLGSFLQLFHWSLVLQRWIVLENSPINNLAGFRTAHCSLLFDLQISMGAVASTNVMDKLPLKPIWLL